MALDAASAFGPVTPASRSIETPSGIGPAAAVTAGSRCGQEHQVAHAHVAEPVGLEPAGQVRRRIVEGRRPDVRRPADRGEQHEDLGQALVEGPGVVRPAQPLEPVPERLALGRVVEQDRVAEVAQVATRDGVDARLVEEQSTHHGGVDRVRGFRFGGERIGHRRHLSRDETCARPESYPAALRDREDLEADDVLAPGGRPRRGCAVRARRLRPGGGASSQAPATSPSAMPASAPPTAGPSASPPTTSASPGASVCRQTDDPGGVAVTIADFEFKPASIEAKVGQVVAFTNTGFEPHNATTVDGGCGHEDPRDRRERRARVQRRRAATGSGARSTAG